MISSSSVKITLGPVIGKTTYNSTRILAEFDKAEEVTCTLKTLAGKSLHTKQIAKANIPIVFKFDDLEPKTHYTVTFSCPSSESRFWTLRKDDDNPGNLNVAVVSCNEISAQFPRKNKKEKKDLWIGIGARAIRHEIDYLFHIGDQFYLDMGFYGVNEDNPYMKVIKILKATKQEEWKQLENQLLEILREACRRTWRYPSVARTLANVPNLTICDDHEFRDDWGYKSRDITPGKPDHYYGELARRVYYEYQRQLREDINFDRLEDLRCEYYDEIIHGVGVSFMEYRGCRSWFKEEKLKETKIGEKQSAWISSLYEKKGKFDKLSATLFISPLPIFFLSRSLSKIVRLKVNDIQEYWMYDSVDQLIGLVGLLRRWKDRKDNRDILVLGGDVHMGGKSDIIFQGEKIFSQLVTSAVNGEQLNKVEMMIVRYVNRNSKLDNDYHFENYGWTEKNNFGLVKVKNVNGVSSIQSELKI